jgi:hypothetical protein
MSDNNEALEIMSNNLEVQGTETKDQDRGENIVNKDVPDIALTYKYKLWYSHLGFSFIDKPVVSNQAPTRFTNRCLHSTYMRYGLEDTKVYCGECTEGNYGYCVKHSSSHMDTPHQQTYLKENQLDEAYHLQCTAYTGWDKSIECHCLKCTAKQERWTSIKSFGSTLFSLGTICLSSYIVYKMLSTMGTAHTKNVIFQDKYIEVLDKMVKA